MSIARRQMALCAQRLYDMHITMEFDDTVIERLIQAADNPSFGARPLRREVTGRIENMLATLMLEGKLSAGDHVRIVTTPDGYTCHLRPQQHNDSILPLPPA
jgi:ATP-dependent Clp protease ATP-binding subunit ClpA